MWLFEMDYSLFKTKRNVCLSFLIILSVCSQLLISCTPSKKYMIQSQKKLIHDHQKVRVLIIKTRDNLRISADTKIRILDIKTGKAIYSGKSRTLIFSVEKVRKPIQIESWKIPIYVNKIPYRGSMEIHNILGSIHVINVLSLDEYIYGVVPSEMSYSWNSEALKAQAIAARTYALYHIMQSKKGIYDLDATTKSQVYKGINIENKKTSDAINETSGEILSYNYKPIITYFHSTCGGKTCDDKYVWTNNDLPYLGQVKCPYCRNSPKYSWIEKLSLYQLKMMLRKEYKGVGKIKSISLKKKEGRVTLVIIQHSNGIIRIPGNRFRLLMGAERIKSLYFIAQKTQNGLLLKGHGWGHGVGMCQWGAKGMADSGKSYEKILRYYYKGVKLTNIQRKIANRDKDSFDKE